MIAPMKSVYPVICTKLASDLAVRAPDYEFDAVDGSSTGTWVPGMWERLPRFGGARLAMQTVTTIGLDIAKSVFQVLDAEGNVLLRRQIKRRYVLAFFAEVAAMSGRYRSLRLVASLVARTPGAWSHRSLDVTGLREALRQAT